MILRAGLTGGIASGKSTVARMLSELGCHVYDADQIVRELYQPGAMGSIRLREHYGEQIFTPDGEVDRSKLAARALGDPASARALNELIHPLVLAREDEIMRAEEEAAENQGRIVVVEATLLLEAGGRNRYDKIVVVDADPQLQLSRAIDRGMLAGDVELRVARQMSRSMRTGLADYVIRNDGDFAALERQVGELYGKLRADLAQKRRARA